MVDGWIESAEVEKPKSVCAGHSAKHRTEIDARSHPVGEMLLLPPLQMGKLRLQGYQGHCALQCAAGTWLQAGGSRAFHLRGSSWLRG